MVMNGLRDGEPSERKEVGTRENDRKEESRDECKCRGDRSTDGGTWRAARRSDTTLAALPHGRYMTTGLGGKDNFAAEQEFGRRRRQRRRVPERTERVDRENRRLSAAPAGPSGRHEGISGILDRHRHSPPARTCTRSQSGDRPKASRVGLRDNDTIVARKAECPARQLRGGGHRSKSTPDLREPDKISAMPS